MEGPPGLVHVAPIPQTQTGPDQRDNQARHPRRRPKKQQDQSASGQAGGDVTQGHSQDPGRNQPRNRAPRPRQNRQEPSGGSAGDGSNVIATQTRRGGRPRSNQKRDAGQPSQRQQPARSSGNEDGHPGSSSDQSNPRPESQRRSQAHGQPQLNSRQIARRRFAGNLTNPDAADIPSSASQTRQKQPKPPPDYPPQPEGNDLTSHLTRLIKTAPYPDCPICYSAVHPMQPTWSCSSDGLDTDGMECCWTTFHMKCIRAWASKSVKETKDAYLARNEDHPGEWRCPNCQCKRTFVPSSYMCFCGSAPDPRPPRFATPHSCASPCTRARKGCAHPCPLQCHPGPCPPCAITLNISCHCGKEVKAARCSHLRAQANQNVSGPGDVRSCGAVCGKQLSCGDPRHSCAEICHEGDCKECTVVLDTKCWCGKESEEVKCGSATLKAGWGCEGACGKLYRCGVHRCEEACHPHPSLDREETCPLDPEMMKNCPCGKVTLEYGGGRTSCQDPVPTCGQICAKELGCGHTCQALCHTGPCSICTKPIEQRCRCGSTSKTIPCHTYTSNASSHTEFICSTPCPSLRSCGRHQCTTRCCPASSLHQPASAASRFKKKKAQSSAAAGGWQEEIDRMEREQLEKKWHICDMVCGKMLGCGSHACEEPDHRGVCPPCLRSSFDELVCHCARTTLLPPIPCGTKITCPYPCTRPTPPCGHARVPHNCHEDEGCPPCPYLTEKTCMCGKNVVRNVRCSTERVGCGIKCGKVLDCGFHHCDKPCHAGECETCSTVCGKDRKLCLPNHHPCELPCHAPFPCDESEPCRASVTLSCPCGRIQQPAPCLRSTSNTNSNSNTAVGSNGGNGTGTPTFSTFSREIKCTPECGIAARNARLADALGISKEVRERGAVGKEVEWSPELRAFAKTNPKFVEMVEKAFADFITGDRKTTVLPSMPESKRNFVTGVGEVYRVSTQAVDKEPHRSISLTRRVDSRIPHPLLSSVINAPLGKLADLRGGSPSLSRSGTPPARPTSSGSSPSAARNWRAVAASNPSPSSLPGSSWAVSSQTSTRTQTQPQTGVYRPPALTSLTPLGAPSRLTSSSTEAVPESWDAD